MRKLEIDLMPATKAQVSLDFSAELAKTANDSIVIELVNFEPFVDRSEFSTLLTGRVADAVRLENIQFQNIENVKAISLVVRTEIAGNEERKEYDLSPYNTMDAFQREKITLDGSITVRKGTEIYVKFSGIINTDTEKPSVVMFADLTRYYK